MRAFLVYLAVYASLPFVPFYPFYGLLLYSWLAYMRPHDVAWGMDDTRLSLMVALAIFIGLLIGVLRGREKLPKINIQSALVIALLLWMSVSTMFAFDRTRATWELTLFAKVVVIALITTGLVVTWKRFRIMVLVMSFSIGALAMKYGVFGLLRGGARFDRGPGGFMRDNNDFAVALNMALPLLVGVALTEKKRWLRGLAAMLAVFCCITIVFTFSRGGLLSMATVIVIISIRMKRPLTAAIVLVLGLLVLLNFTPASFQEAYISRAQSISEHEEDKSASTRLEMWGIALQMGADHPLFGVGPDNFLTAFPNYSSGDPHVSHNALMQLLSESGFPAAAFWLALIASSLWKLEKIRRSKFPETSRYAAALQAAIAGYFVGSMFLDKAIFDLFYQLVALSVCLEIVAASASNQQQASKLVPEPAEWWRHEPASASSRG